MSAPPPAVLDSRAERTGQLKAAAGILVVLAVLGAVLGVIWELWSPPGPVGLQLPGGVEADETEAFVAGDGRFALMVAIVGLLAGLAAWYLPALRRYRGPYVALGLAVGGVGGAALTEWIGYLIRGQGTRYTCGDGTVTCIKHLPLTVHMHALLLAEAVLAVLVYILFVAFAVADDLGRPEPWAQPGPVPVPAATGAWTGGAPTAAPSVGPQGDLEQTWRHGDGAGPA